MASFTVQLSPLARFHLLTRFTGYSGPFTSQTESKAFRSAFNRLGLRVIQDAAERSGGQLSARQVASTVPSSFVMTFDEVQILRAVANSQPRSGAVELALGGLVDDLDAILDGTARDEGGPAPGYLDPASEDWSPPKSAAPLPDTRPETAG